LKLCSAYRHSAGQRVRIALSLKSIEYGHIAVGEIGWDACQKIRSQRFIPAFAAAPLTISPTIRDTWQHPLCSAHVIWPNYDRAPVLN
jgi:hypothetical protein